MTRRTNGRVAGFAFLIYIAVSLSGMILGDRASRGEDVAGRLASLARNVSAVRLAIVFDLVGCLCALVLAVTLYAITRDEDPDLALLAAVCRVAEGVVGGISLPRAAGRLWLATGGEAMDPGTASTLGAVLMRLPSWSMEIGASFFAVGSLLFAWLFLRGRIVPVALAWLGVLASVLVVVILPLQLVGIAGRPLTDLMWIPMLVFEVWLAFRLIFKGAAVPVRRQTA